MANRALLIGINEYRTLNPLRGCGNDVFNVSTVLREFAGFGTMDVRALAHDRATKKNIEERLAWLVDGAQPGDLLVLHFSCHGTQIRDRNGSDLGDGLDEVLCPHDMDWDGNFISDEYLQQRLRVPKGVVLEVILDACHSGQGSNRVSFSSTPNAPTLAENDDVRARFVEPPVDILIRQGGADLNVRRLFRGPGASKAGVALWSACADFQTAADARIEGIFNGAFTYYLCEHPGKTWER